MINIKYDDLRNLTTWYEPYFEWMLYHFTSPNYLERLKKAKNEFFQATGKVDDGEPYFELRMKMFVEWYIWDRVNESGRSCAEEFLIEMKDRLTQHEIEVFRSIVVTHRMVAQILYWGKGYIWIRDIIRGGIWKVAQTFPLIGINKKDIVDCRVIRQDERLYFTKGIMFHPSEAVPYILQVVEEAKRYGMRNDEIMNTLAKMKLNYDRYSKIKINNIYKLSGYG